MVKEMVVLACSELQARNKASTEAGLEHNYINPWKNPRWSTCVELDNTSPRVISREEF